jgi:hypothetical protein
MLDGGEGSKWHAWRCGTGAALAFVFYAGSSCSAAWPVAPSLFAAPELPSNTPATIGDAADAKIGLDNPLGLFALLPFRPAEKPAPRSACEEKRFTTKTYGAVIGGLVAAGGVIVWLRAEFKGDPEAGVGVMLVTLPLGAMLGAVAGWFTAGAIAPPCRQEEKKEATP